MSARRHVSTVIFVALSGLLLSTAAAQPIPYVPPEFYQEQRRLQEDSITFCIWEVSPTSDLDRDVAQAIASTLLLEAELYIYESRIPLIERFWETVYIQLAEHCDALMGFKIVPGGYPDWLIPSRPYYQAPYVLAVTNEEYESLEDIPTEEVVGSPVLTLADYTFQDYLRSLPESQRWRRFPYTTGDLQLRHLEQGTIAGAIIWAPTLQELTNGEPESRGFQIASLDPLPAQSEPVGVILRAYNSLLRSQIDDAIDALVQDGVMDELLEQHGLPGGSPSSH